MKATLIEFSPRAKMFFGVVMVLFIIVLIYGLNESSRKKKVAEKTLIKQFELAQQGHPTSADASMTDKDREEMTKLFLSWQGPGVEAE